MANSPGIPLPWIGATVSAAPPSTRTDGSGFTTATGFFGSLSMLGPANAANDSRRTRQIDDLRRIQQRYAQSVHFRFMCACLHSPVKGAVQMKSSRIVLAVAVVLSLVTLTAFAAVQHGSSVHG